MSACKVHLRSKAQLRSSRAKGAAVFPNRSASLLRSCSVQWLCGIRSRQEVKLSNLGRTLGAAVPLIRTEKRLSRNLNQAE